MWYVACGMLYPTEEQLFCLLFSITDESLGFTCVSFTHGFLSLFSPQFKKSRHFYGKVTANIHKK